MAGREREPAPRAPNRLGTGDRPLRRVLFLPDWYNRDIHAGVARYAQQAGWVLDAFAAHEVKPFRYEPWRGDGIITILGTSQVYLDSVLSAGVPLVDLALERRDLPHPHVAQDCAAQGRAVAEHFLERKLRHAAFVGPTTTWSAGGRFRGLTEAMAAAGASCSALPLPAAGGPAPDPIAWLARRMADLPRPVGVMVEGDEQAVQVIDACRSAGLLVPEQVAVVGCHNDPLTCECAPVPLSSVDCNMTEQGYRAAALLDRLISGEPAPPEPVLIPPVGVVVRQSSDMLAVPHVEVAKAIRFIWEHINDHRLGVEDVVDATTLSRPGLSKAFRQHIGTPVGRYIRRRRLEGAMDLLYRTNVKVASIAKMCGYRDAEHLRSTLRRETGSGPRALRARRRQS